jgi:hypothetical protein
MLTEVISVEKTGVPLFKFYAACRIGGAESLVSTTKTTLAGPDSPR